MNRLFLKFFLWLLAANLLAAAATLLLARPLLSSWAEDRRSEVSSLAGDAVAIYEDQGPAALADWQQRLRREREIGLLLIGPDRRPVTPPPPDMRPILRHWRERRDAAMHSRHSPDRVQPRGPRGQMPIMVRIDGQRGQYSAVGLMPRPGREALGTFGGLRLAISAAVLALLALIFSSAMARPLRRLTEVARRMAGGDLGARASPEIGVRRDEIGDLATEFDRMAGKIESLLNTQQQLLRDISHELRSPLARMEVALELARQRSGDSAELERISLEATRLADLIGGLLDFTRLEHGADLQRERLDLAGLVRELLADLNFESEPAPVNIHSQLPPRLDITGNPAMLRSAIENVLRNALKYAPPGSVVDLDLRADQGCARLLVRDRGPGVKRESLGRIFEPFYRESGARDRASGGYGVGLAIVDRVAKAHQGQVRARNAADGGLEVELELPIDVK